jgi:hypothetical protein
MTYILDLLLVYKKFKGNKVTMKVRRHLYVRQPLLEPVVRPLSMEEFITPSGGPASAFQTFHPPCCSQCCGSGMGKKSGSGSGMNNPDHISESLETISLGLKIPYLNSLMRIRDPGWKKFGSGICFGKKF